MRSLRVEGVGLEGSDYFFGGGIRIASARGRSVEG